MTRARAVRRGRCGAQDAREVADLRAYSTASEVGRSLIADRFFRRLASVCVADVGQGDFRACARPDRRPGGAGPGYRAELPSGMQLPIPTFRPHSCEPGSPRTSRPKPGGRLATTGAGAKLKAMFQKIVREFRTRYVLPDAPQGVASSGWRLIEVRLKNRRGWAMGNG